MTTIAYRNGVLAGDQRLSEKAMIWHDKCRKVFRLRDGSLFGASGDQEAGEILFAGVKKGILLPSIPKDAEVNAIRVTVNGKIYFYEGHVWIRWPEPFLAIGSGKRYALTALRLGFDAVAAVRSGILGDVYSGGRVQSVRLSKE